jgi:hypothetical protein
MAAGTATHPRPMSSVVFAWRPSPEKLHLVDESLLLGGESNLFSKALVQHPPEYPTEKGAVGILSTRVGSLPGFGINVVLLCPHSDDCKPLGIRL